MSALTIPDHLNRLSPMTPTVSTTHVPQHTTRFRWWWEQTARPPPCELGRGRMSACDSHNFLASNAHGPVAPLQFLRPQQTAPPDSSGHRLIGIPPVTDNTSRLWRNPADRARLNTELSDGFFGQRGEGQRGELSIGAQVAIAIVVIAVGLLIYAAIIKKASGQ